MSHKIEVVVNVDVNEENTSHNSKEHRRSSLFDIELTNPPRLSVMSTNNSLNMAISKLENLSLTLTDPIVDLSKPKLESVPRFSNTFRTESTRPFKPHIVRKIIENILHDELKEEKYDPLGAPQKCGQISSIICRAVKSQNFDRYKIVALVRIIQKKFQGARMITSFLWDKERDNFAFASFENTHMYAMGIVYGIYYE